MKTLKLFSLFMLLSILSMGMGFPDIISDKDIAEMQANRKLKKQKAVKTEMMACSGKMYVSAAAKAEIPQKTQAICTNEANKEAESNFICQAATSLNNIALKVFDVKGNLLMKEQVRMEEFLSSNFSAALLPEGSTFVMFHGNTAYYFVDGEN